MKSSKYVMAGLTVIMVWSAAIAPIVHGSDDAGIVDTVDLVWEVTPDAQTQQLQVQLDLYVFNDSNNVLGVGMGFTWTNPNLQMDSAVPSSLVDGIFDYLFTYDRNEIDSTNSNEAFLLGGASDDSIGIPDSSFRVLWASYYFTLSEWDIGDSIVIDTLWFSPGSRYKFSTDNFESYKPYWTGQKLWVEAPPPPDAPDLISPSDESTITDLTPTMKWNSSWSAIDYEIEIDNNSNFGSPEQAEDSITDTVWTVPSNLGYSTYYWHVRARNDSGNGDWSEAWEFAVEEPPSCPTLFVHDGTEFVQDNPLLTACEITGYENVVTDYYLLGIPIQADDAKVRFQLRELQDEITYLDSLQLITVDHLSTSDVGCSVDGRIFAFEESVQPISAIDDRGEDQLAAVIAEDGETFSASGAGHLIVAFPNVVGGGIDINPTEKERCLPKPSDEGGESALAAFRVEILDDAGNWNELPAIPPREKTTREIVVNNLPDDVSGDIVTLRISWGNGYSTDVIRQYVPSGERIYVAENQIAAHRLMSGTAREWSGFSGTPLTLRKGDVLEFSFETSEPVIPGLERDYIVVATGRYEPDYSVYDGLLADDFRLIGNYPNPFNPTTTLTYYLPTASDVTLEIFNLLGQQVALLVDEHQEAGVQSVVWDAINSSGDQVATGVYLYRLRAGSFTESKKMMFLK